MIVKQKNLKFFELRCSIIAPSMTYETYLVEVLNGSHFFGDKRLPSEQFRLIKNQSHGEDDAKSSLYKIDFKLIVDQDVMNAMSKNRPAINRSQIHHGIVFIKEKDNPVPVPKNMILQELRSVKESDLDMKPLSKNMSSLKKNLNKRKNLFLYYSYEFSLQIYCPGHQFEGWLNQSLGVLVRYRTKEQPGYDTFLCIKANRLFLIYQWISEGFRFRDHVHEALCPSYLDIKRYAFY